MKSIDDVRTITIVGGGTIGPGVGLAYAMAGYDVWVVDIKDEPLTRAQATVDAACSMMAEEDYLSAADAELARNRIVYSTDVDEGLRRADWIQDCVPEIVSIKQDFYVHAEAVCQPDIWFGTNTSTMKLSDIAARMERPERLVGVHWFAPPYLFPTVEVLRGDATLPEAVEFAVELMRRTGKVPSVLRDIPGFILNRFQHSIMTTALEIVEEGGVTYEDVDNAFRYGLAIRFPLWGIFGTHDRGVHKKTSADAGGYISQATGNPKYGPHPLLLQAGEAGRWGIMAGRDGWYDYPDKDAVKRDKDRELIRFIKLLKTEGIL
jgi:3-hydroxyacyl-CoA dehydrogenase